MFESPAATPAERKSAAQRQDASVILLTYNGDKYLAQTIEMLWRQQQLAEIIAIDSGSTDATLDILQQPGVILHQIPKADFGHARTRNLAAKMASGKYIVFLTQDATPADSCWLEQLLMAFQRFGKVAGCYSRQIPRPGANPLDANDIRVSFPIRQKTRSLPESGFHSKNVWELIHFSNSSSAYHRELLLENPFREDLPMAEDQEWAMRMLSLGYSTVYEPESMVLHSHDHTLREKYRRDFQMGGAFSKFLSPLLGRRKFPLIQCLYHMISDAAYIRRYAPSQWKWLFRSPIHRAAIHFAYYRGWNLEARKIIG